MLVPRAAIRTENGQSFAFVVANGIAERRAVRTGDVDGDRQEVVAGLSDGERVIVSPPVTLTAGQPVAVK
jgi:multidrug efflux system membrane fusion protein